MTRGTREVVAAWFGVARCHVACLSATGFSGTTPLRVDTDRGSFVLKAFTAGTTPERAAWIHRFMRTVREAGVHEVPEVLESEQGGTIVTGGDGVLWEMVERVDGEACDAPLPSRTAAALGAIARVHQSAAMLEDQRSVAWASRHGMPRALLQRREHARRLRARTWRERSRSIGISSATDGPWHIDQLMDRWVSAADILATARVERMIQAVADAPVPVLRVQPVLRDVWSAHVLFARDSDRVTGIIDFHAAGIDTPATDLARLMGSWWPGDDAASWSARCAAGVAAYERVRPLEPFERRLIPWLAATGIIFGLDNWFRWTLEEKRSFADWDAVLARVDRLVAALPAAVERLGDGDECRV